MDKWISDRQTDGAFLYSKGSNGMVKLGATYEGFEFGGNNVCVHVDRSLDVEFPNRKYAIMIDLTSDASTGKPACEFFTFRGGSYIKNTIKGVGGSTGLESGVVSSPVAGVKYTAFGYGALAVYNPYKSCIFISEKTGDSYWA